MGGEGSSGKEGLFDYQTNITDAIILTVVRVGYLKNSNTTAAAAAATTTTTTTTTNKQSKKISEVYV